VSRATAGRGVFGTKIQFVNKKHRTFFEMNDGTISASVALKKLMFGALARSGSRCADVDFAGEKFLTARAQTSPVCLFDEINFEAQHRRHHDAASATNLDIQRSC
jgi:hypothetical protein